MTAEENSIVDLSESGVCIKENKQRSADSPVRVRINELEIPGRVVYSKELSTGSYRTGIEFKETEQKREKIAGVVDKYSKGVSISGAVIE
ncbi:MAG: PilZ domain-containing protein [Chitinivibrionales bacterium]